MDYANIYLDKNQLIFYLAADESDLKPRDHYTHEEIQSFLDDLDHELNPLGYRIYLSNSSPGLPYDDFDDTWGDIVKSSNGLITDTFLGITFYEKEKTIKPDFVDRLLRFRSFSAHDKLAEVFRRVKRKYRS